MGEINTNYCLSKPIGKSLTTGAMVIQSYMAPSGFNYQVGVREACGLLIFEWFAEGTACTYLCAIRVIDKETNKAICNIPVEWNTYYNRQMVMELVHSHLCNAIGESAIKEGKATDQMDVAAQVEKILDECYFGESRKAALSWAERVGIFH